MTFRNNGFLKKTNLKAVKSEKVKKKRANYQEDKFEYDGSEKEKYGNDDSEKEH